MHHEPALLRTGAQATNSSGIAGVARVGVWIDYHLNSSMVRSARATAVILSCTGRSATTTNMFVL